MSVQCTHEAYLGRCVHCGAQIINGRAMLSTSPDPATDEALVERVARAIYPHMFAHSDYNEVPFAEAMSRPRYAFLKERVLHAALAAIRAMEEKP